MFDCGGMAFNEAVGKSGLLGKAVYDRVTKGTWAGAARREVREMTRSTPPTNIIRVLADLGA